MKHNKSGKNMKKGHTGEAPCFGAIFMSNRHTLKECLEKGLFGLPAMFSNFVSQVRVGMILFLFEYEKRQLHGVFEATSNGKSNIIPKAYSSSGSRFPAQVCVNRIWHCHPLEESEFRDVLRENYYELKKFNFGLSKDQVHQLLILFESRKGVVPHNSSGSEMGVDERNSLTKEVEKSEMTGSENFGTKPDCHMKTESELSGFIPLSSSKLEENEINSLTRVKELEEDEIIESEISTTKADSPMKNESELGDFIPLPSSDDSDTEECEHVPEVSAPSLPLPRLVSMNTRQNKETGLHRTEGDLVTKGLYADSPKKRTSVFSRVIFSLKESVKEETKKDTKDSLQEMIELGMDQSVSEIMKELQQRLKNHWKGRKVEVKRENQSLSNKKRISVFSRLGKPADSAVKMQQEGDNSERSRQNDGHNASTTSRLAGVEASLMHTTKRPRTEG